MKISLFICLIIFTAQVRGCFRDKIEGYVVACLRTSPGNKAVIAQNFELRIVDPGVACLMECVFIKLDVINCYGQINMKGVQQFKYEAYADCKHYNDCGYVQDANRLELCAQNSTGVGSRDTCGLGGTICKCLFNYQQPRQQQQQYHQQQQYQPPQQQYHPPQQQYHPPQQQYQPPQQQYQPPPQQQRPQQQPQQPSKQPCCYSCYC